MSTKALTAEYEAWVSLPENANVPKISADEACSELIAQCDALGLDNPQDRPEPLKRQIEWLSNFAWFRWDRAQKAEDICDKWIARIGGGFHPDTRGADYIEHAAVGEVRCFSDSEAAEYDADIDNLFALASDPYAYAVEAMERADAKFQSANPSSNEKTS